MEIRLETILYILGGIFGAAAIIYFAWEYLTVLPRIIKAGLLLLLMIVFIFLGKHLEERDL